VFPVYLVKRSTGRDGSHFLPGSELFQPQDKYKVLLSTTIWTIFFSFLVWAGFQYGFYALLNLYIIPYYIFVVWLSLVTFLHHTDTDLPWYRDEEWNFVKGAVSTKDRSYGIFEPIHHNIGTHIVHHLFPKIPHYNLKKATEMVRPILGNFYKKTNEPLWKSFYRAYKFCHYIPDNGKKIYYTSDAKGKS
jgi:omega-3 fatty acid desaturase (delta-15 desaturase)